jgi:alpha-1,6-mannosyltransferase
VRDPARLVNFPAQAVNPAAADHQLNAENTGALARSGFVHPAATAYPAVLRSQWIVAAFLTCVFSLLVTLFSNRFGYDRDVLDMPVLLVTACLVGAGTVFALCLPRLIRRSEGLTNGAIAPLLTIMIAGGIAARLILFASQPILEDDYQRYLWDGAVTAHAMNPYETAPRAVVEAGPAHALSELAAESGLVVRRINHPLLTTIYPPVAQAAFALAYMISPWSLAAWRAVLMVCDAATLFFLLALLKATGRSPLWSALYWLNPLVLKEGFNSAHMEPLVVALVMLALWLAATRRPVWATTALGFATGAKLWPALLLPVVVRPLASNRLKFAAALSLFAGLLALWAAPIFATGLPETSGFRAYTETWRTNSALFPILENFTAGALFLFNLDNLSPALVAKFAIGLALAGFSISQAHKPISDTETLIMRAAAIIALLVLLSPAQYPWYLLWLVPFLAFWPSPAALLLCATIPLYYASFHFIAHGTIDVARPALLALIWVPVWALASFEMWQLYRPQNHPSSNVGDLA